MWVYASEDSGKTIVILNIIWIRIFQNIRNIQVFCISVNVNSTTCELRKNAEGSDWWLSSLFWNLLISCYWDFIIKLLECIHSAYTIWWQFLFVIDAIRITSCYVRAILKRQSWKKLHNSDHSTESDTPWIPNLKTKNCLRTNRGTCRWISVW